MRHGSALSTPLHHRPHLPPPPQSSFSFRRSIWRGIVALARRPVLALTLGIVAVLLFGAASEAFAARSLERRVVAQHRQNEDLRAQLNYATQHIHLSQSPAAIMAAALRLGMVAAPTPTPGP